MENSIKGQYRQGDVLIMDGSSVLDQGEEIPLDNGRVVLAYGEVTGHAHAIKGSPKIKHFRSKASQLRTYLKLFVADEISPVVLRHEEHREIPIKEANKEIRIQRQWSTERIQRVID